ncbi:XAP5-domain-containing protein [Cantharellus anzutake]|uniref:XAP5-domain-containing protein n=1 Tax=Cantharellus anzutake TaxID=1750568 RepID=UPI00190467B1|nr:XAP5-domain-containing protein [Cantharellus anzutake]KAF8343893.1 XAP5-domain-containing protein [Cantharellus anzutake]
MSGHSSQSEHRRQAALDKARQEMLHEFDRQREAITKDTEKSRPGSNRFVGQNDSVEETLKKSTIGLVRLEDFQNTRKALEEAKAREAARTDDLKEEKRKKKRKRGVTTAPLSFSLDEEGDIPIASDQTKSFSDEQPSADREGEKAQKRAKLIKNPSVDTSFLPDREREEEERRAREELRQEWLRKQEEIKAEEIEIVYSYWDGSGHRKSIKCKKGNDVATFLGLVRAQVPELRGVSVDNLMYVKEDLIIPHHHTFYDFIVNKARGKSGPLFNFDVHDDVRLMVDATIEKDESHAGKVVERSWYQRSKHIFPASRWEVFDPEKNYGKYTIA